ncbi:MAG: NAD(P)/FAD-dependent oxidoreductase [Bacteroidales bacterium]|nr:NAD(P)/FAD-dependent oxidoreductase [Bacteroidales bacterium]
MRIAVIGAGAAGCFSAIELKRRLPDASICIYEAGKTPLAKVAITGGGRCNLTNSFAAIDNLAKAYPRGERLMKRALSAFSNEDVWKWFEKEGVRLVLQDDNCVFPKSQDAMQIVRTLTGLLRRLGVGIKTEHKVMSIDPGFRISFADGTEAEADKVIVTTGGSKSFPFLQNLGLEIVQPVPSLFTFNIDSPIKELMGTVVENASASIPGTRFKAEGPLLITDWGMSGPAILKLSSYAARYLADNGYKTDISVNWLGCTAEQAKAFLDSTAAQNQRRQLSSVRPDALPARLWDHIIAQAGLDPVRKWAELGRKGLNRLAETLTGDIYEMTGKGRFKDEFVTCGGVSLSEINISTMESKKHPGLYFAGEVLDIDAITGGFNLQAAWSTGYVAAVSAATAAGISSAARR